MTARRERHIPARSLGRCALNTNRVYMCVHAVCIVRRNRFHGSRNYTVRNDPTAGSTWRRTRPENFYAADSADSSRTPLRNNVGDAFTRSMESMVHWVHQRERDVLNIGLRAIVRRPGEVWEIRVVLNDMDFGIPARSRARKSKLKLAPGSEIIRSKSTLLSN